MPEVKFTQNLERHLSAPAVEVAGARPCARCWIRSSSATPSCASYVLDDQGRLRKHVVVFVDGELVEDRIRLSDPVEPAGELFVMQALIGRIGMGQRLYVATRKGLFGLDPGR